jgi:hypothetical protein
MVASAANKGQAHRVPIDAQVVHPLEPLRKLVVPSALSRHDLERPRRGEARERLHHHRGEYDDDPDA